MSELSSGLAVVSAFMSGVAVLTFGGAAYHGIVNAIKNYRKANTAMAVRNK